MGRKHALIITAYQEIDFLIELLCVYSKYFFCYVHIDKKTKLGNSDLKRIEKIPNVKLIQKYKINWGSYKHILAIKDLIVMAVNDRCEYFSVISANMLPVKNPQKIIKFFENNNEKIFMEVRERKSMDNEKAYSLFDYRYKAYFFQHIYNLRNPNRLIRRLNGIFEEKCAMLQQKLHIRQNISFDYKGYVYCHFSRQAAEYLVKYLQENPKYIQELKYCYVGEEFFFQNIWMHSEYQDLVVKSALVFDIWSEDRGWPANLELGDWENIKKSKYLFARKIQASNKEVFEKIREEEEF